jgi:PiT family inorganic phosphate transporter
VASWVVSPLLSGIISYLVFRLLLQTIFYRPRPLRAAKKLTPYLVFVVFSILTLTLVFKGLKNLKLDLELPQALLLAAGVGIVAALVSMVLVARIKEDDLPEDEKQASRNREKTEYIGRSLEKATRHLQRVRAASAGHAQLEISGVLDDLHRLRMETRKHYDHQTDSTELQKVEKLFIYLQILSACFVAFAHGANDVANSIGPMSAVIAVAREGGQAVAANAPVPMWVLALGGVGIVVGLATWGWRVMETIGRKITHLTPTRGFAAEFGAATTIVVASKLGLPISTTHTLVGAVLGVGLARGISALNLSMVRDIFASWIVTIPAGAGLAIVFFYILQIFF